MKRILVTLTLVAMLAFGAAAFAQDVTPGTPTVNDCSTMMGVTVPYTVSGFGASEDGSLEFFITDGEDGNFIQAFEISTVFQQSGVVTQPLYSGTNLQVPVETLAQLTPVDAASAAFYSGQGLATTAGQEVLRFEVIFDPSPETATDTRVSSGQVAVNCDTGQSVIL